MLTWVRAHEHILAKNTREHILAKTHILCNANMNLPLNFADTVEQILEQVDHEYQGASQV
jgi:hypothetical protein